MTIFEDVAALIKSNITDAKVMVTDLTGTQDHLGITVASDAFLGKMLFQQHKMIMDILAPRLKQDIHAVQIKTMTLAQASEQNIFN
ncbi:BolA-like protein [Bacteriovorax sp. BSW11_IV]|uniref:BolA/IbaG family iron-sulfur metabolism protein n=1 Tax=Bacteriovorax sp. BSW11_IV TaxID=1353529 RepID=UPI00038A35ED|nr:BolA family protein [Bacteriovorax sp. BSW11_IV]EQC44568.1 BolA-like protein [Bacteriovorax sp. BSW11_IV]